MWLFFFFLINKGWKNVSSYSHFTDGELKNQKDEKAGAEKDLDDVLTAT